MTKVCYIIYMFNLFDKNLEIGVGVDIGHNSIKVVELKKENSEIVIQNYVELELASYAGLDLGQAVDIGLEKKTEALKYIFDKNKFSIKNVYVSIPSIESYLFTIDMPLVKDEDIESAIGLEVRKYIPIPINELIIDHWLIQKDTVKARMQYSIIAVKKSIIDNYLAIFKAAGLNILGFEMETFAAIRSLALGPDKNYLVVDTGGAYTVATLMSKGILYKSVTIQIGGNNITNVIKNSLLNGTYTEMEQKKRKIVNKELSDNAIMNVIDMCTYPLLEELGHIAESMERGYNLSIDQVVCVGGNARTLLTSMKVNECFHSPCVLGTGFSGTKYPEYLQQMMNRAGAEFEIAAGLALKAFIKNESKQ